ncbi:hypothetical protein HDU76_012675 [Blyttiomyces sp. JEL0837]|nr:hypothetical protein HDU76_012675 [Blyttiomyces sp. JEL0837]
MLAPAADSSSTSSDTARDSGAAPQDTRMASWDSAYEKGLFSDITLTVMARAHRLHKVVLYQSPFLRRFLLDSTQSEVSIADDMLILETGADRRLSNEAIEITLRDLYNDKRRSQIITWQNVMSILAAACFLELSDLATYCSDFALQSLNKENVMHYAFELENLRVPQVQVRLALTPYGADHAYLKMLRIHHNDLQSAVLLYMCQLVNTTVSLGSEQEVEELFNQMPIRWLKKVVECDGLAVADEFERYTLLKKVTVSRRKHLRANGRADGDNMIPSMGGRSNVSRLFESIISSVAGAKRPRGSDGELPASKSLNHSPARGMLGAGERDEKAAQVQFSDSQPAANSSRFFTQSSQSGVSTPTDQNLRSIPGLSNLYGDLGRPLNDIEEHEDTVIASVFKNGITYTFMTFAQLEKVKMDKIVPDSSVMQSFWMQAELANRIGSPHQGTIAPRPSEMGSQSIMTSDMLASMGNFKFAVRFRNVRNFFKVHPTRTWENVTMAEKDKMMPSDPVKCAGADFRLLLALAAEDSISANPTNQGGNASQETTESQKTSNADASQKSVAGAFPLRTASLKQNGSKKTRLALKAHLQRLRSNNSGGPSTSKNLPKTPSYSLYVFDIGKFKTDTSQQWKEYKNPVTTCDFEGVGHVRPFPFPTPPPVNVTTEGEAVEGCGDDIWVIAVMHFLDS